MTSRTGYKKVIKKASLYLLDARSLLTTAFPIAELRNLIDSYSRSFLLFENIILGCPIVKTVGTYNLLQEKFVAPQVREWCNKVVKMDQQQSRRGFELTMDDLHRSRDCMRPQCCFKPPCKCGWTLKGSYYILEMGI